MNSSLGRRPHRRSNSLKGVARLLLHRFRRTPHLRADGNGPGRLPHRGDLFDADAADRGRRELVGDMPVKRTREIGEERRLEPEILDDRPASRRDRPV